MKEGRFGCILAMFIALCMCSAGIGNAADGPSRTFQLAYGSLSDLTDSSAAKSIDVADSWRAEITRSENGVLTGVIKVGIGERARPLRFSGDMLASGAVRGTLFSKTGRRVGKFEGARDAAGASGTFHAGGLSGKWTWPMSARN